MVTSSTFPLRKVWPDLLISNPHNANTPPHSETITIHHANILLSRRLIVHASVPSNTFAIYGAGEDKELTELVPGILNQLGPDSLASLRKLAESYQSMQKKEDGKGGGKDKEAGESDDDDDIPDLVEGENFESKVE